MSKTWVNWVFFRLRKKDHFQIVLKAIAHYYSSYLGQDKKQKNLVSGEEDLG